MVWGTAMNEPDKLLLLDLRLDHFYFFSMKVLMHPLVEPMTLILKPTARRVWEQAQQQTLLILKCHFACRYGCTILSIEFEFSAHYILLYCKNLNPRTAAFDYLSVVPKTLFKWLHLPHLFSQHCNYKCSLVYYKQGFIASSARRLFKCHLIL